jgi:xylose isomerase
VKAMRTQKFEYSTKHLVNSRTVFLRLLEISRSLDENAITHFINERNYEELDMYIIEKLIG